MAKYHENGQLNNKKLNILFINMLTIYLLINNLTNNLTNK